MEKQRNQPLSIEGAVIDLFFENQNIMLEVNIPVELTAQTKHQAGSLKNILHHLQSEPATAFEIEAAIATIEDELMPVIPLLPENRKLVTSEPGIHQIAGLVSAKKVSNLKVEEVERLFNCLADVAYGTPAKILGIPENREFAATLLYLRELMHHAGFPVITLLESE